MAVAQARSHHPAQPQAWTLRRVASIVDSYVNKVQDPYKTLCVFLLGVTFTLAGVWFTSVKNTVSREEIPGIMREYTNKLAAMEAQNETLRVEVQMLQIAVARISDKVGVIRQ